MTIDEAIERARDVASEQRMRSSVCTQNDSECDKFSACLKCAEEHEQLAEWLEDYKHIKQWKSDVMNDFCKYDVSSFEELINNARNKAIDDFVERIESVGYVSVCEDCLSKRQIKEIADQLMRGNIND